MAMVAVAVLAVSACAGQNGVGSNQVSNSVLSAAAAQGESNGTYTAPKVSDIGKVSVAVDKPFTSYNNAVSSAGQSSNSYALIQVLARPFMIDGNNKILLNKDVMDSVGITSTNPQVVTWKTKKGVKWSDGKPWGCKDFYLAWLAESGQDTKPDKSTYFQPSSTTGYAQISSAKCVDEQTFTAIFSTPFADYQSLFSLSDELLPAHVIEEQTGISDITTVTPTSPPDVLSKVADFWNNKWNGFNPKLALASGPYQIKEWTPQVSVTLIRNPQWTGNPGGPAEIVVKAIPDLNAQVQALQNDEVQVLASSQSDASAAATLRGLSGQRISYGSSPGLDFEHIDLNLNRPLFKDIAVRKAVANCINRNEIVDKLIKPVQDDAKPLGSVLFFPGADGYQDDYAGIMTNSTDTSKKILQDDGWTLGQDNVFAKNGQRLAFSIGHTDTQTRKQIVELVRNACAKAGIDIQDATDPNFLDNALHSGNFDAALYADTVSPFQSASVGVFRSQGGQNFIGLSEKNIDDALDMATQQTDQAKAMPYYQQADKAIAGANAMFPLFQIPEMWSTRGITGVYFQSFFGTLWDANEWQKSTK